MSRLGICEERGSGVDKVIFQTEIHQLFASFFETAESSTRAVLFTHRPLREMDRADCSRVCYLPACLRYLEREAMANSSLRACLGFEIFCEGWLLGLESVGLCFYGESLLKRAAIRRRREDSLGRRPATRVRPSIWLLRVSQGLKVGVLLRCASGREKMAKPLVISLPRARGDRGSVSSQGTRICNQQGGILTET